MKVDFFVYRNFTTENLFQGFDISYSGYNDISEVPKDAKSFIWFYLPEIKLKTSEIIEEINGYRSKLEFLVNQIPENKTIIVFTINPLFILKYQNADFRIEKSIMDHNYFLYELALSKNNVKVIDFSEFSTKIDTPLIDWKYYYLSQSIISPRHNLKFKNWFNIKLKSIENKRKKCLVLDLDNTLWGGILGEDGLENLKIGDAYPGLAYLHFQEAILEASKAGIILALCSKNNEEDVMEVFEKHPFQLIKFNHISAHRINWQDKATNIQEIAEELNIGLDSIVFIDDNPAERERVKQMLPEVEVPDFPSSPIFMASYFKDIYERFFQAYKLTNEDLNKTAQYIANAERNVFKKSFTTVDEYLESLEMELEVHEASNFTIPRISQMTQKTNQFNLTTNRYTEEDIRNFISNNSLVYCLSVKDKFGDNGISLLSIIKIENNIGIIDTLLLSCRILGRNIEATFLNYIINILYDLNIKQLNATFRPTKKNKQTENFYDKMGFELIKQTGEGEKHYKIDINSKREIEKYFKFK
jgi:FkbH-like protein